MMRTGLAAVVALLLLCLSGSNSFANPKRQLVPGKVVDIHFADAKGKVHTLAVSPFVQSPMAQECLPIYELEARAIAATRQPELYEMAYLGSTCHGAKPPKNSSAKQHVDDRAAMVVLFFVDPEGQFHYSSFGRKKTGEYQMGTCPGVVKKTEKALLKQVQADHVGQEYRGASCFLRSTNYANFQTR